MEEPDMDTDADTDTDTDTELRDLLHGRLDPGLLFDWLRGAEVKVKSDGRIFRSRTRFVAAFLAHVRAGTESLLCRGRDADSADGATVLGDEDDSLGSLTRETSALSPILSARVRFRGDLPTDSSACASTPRRRPEGVPRERPDRDVAVGRTGTGSDGNPKDDSSSSSIGPDDRTGGLRGFPGRSKSRLSNRDDRHANERSCDSSSTSNGFPSDVFGSIGDAASESRPDRKIDIDDPRSFPAIDTKRRIKPTKIVAGGSAESSDFGVKRDEREQNDAFGVQHFRSKEEAATFESERSVLRKEREKLLRKFRSLCDDRPTEAVSSVASASKSKRAYPSISSASRTFANPDPAKVTRAEMLTVLARLYSLIIDENLVSSVSSELHFIISLVGARRPIEDESDGCDDTSPPENLLSDIHNCIYFALVTLEGQKRILGFLLDRKDFQLLQKNERIIRFAPNLAKYFADLSSLRRNEKIVLIPKSEIVYKNVCFLSETDSKDNFPSEASFRSFKVQRDLFYELFSYWEKEHATSKTYAATYSVKVRKIISLSCTSTNMSHLARLFREQLIATCIIIHKDDSEQMLAQLQSKIGSNNLSQDKLAMLANRFTAPAVNVQYNKKSPFSVKEEFFKDFILYSDSLAFQQHLIDSLIDEIYRLNDEFAFPSSGESKEAIVSVETKLQYVICVKTLCILSKFLGYLLALPYSIAYTVKQSRQDKSSYRMKNNENTFTEIQTISNKSMMSGDIAVRTHTQPPIDLVSILYKSSSVGKLIVSLPWIAQLLTLLDQESLRLPYYENLLRLILTLCLNAINGQTTSYGSKVLLRLVIGHLSDRIQFPQDYYFASLKENKNGLTRTTGEHREVPRSLGLDTLDILDSSILLEVCPFLRELRTALSICIDNKKQTIEKNARHITPVTSKFGHISNTKKKEKQLQIQLEEWFLRSYPNSVAFALQVVSERVGSIITKLAKAQLNNFKEKERHAIYHGLVTMTLHHKSDKDLEAIALCIHENLVSYLKSKLVEAGKRVAKERCEQSLLGILPPGIPLAARKKLLQICIRKAEQPLQNWVKTNQYFDDLYNIIDIEIIIKSIRSNPELCSSIYCREDYNHMFKDDELAVRNEETDVSFNKGGTFDEIFVSPANVMNAIKEIIILCLSGESSDIQISENLLSKVIDDAIRCCQNDSTQFFCMKTITQLLIDATIFLIAFRPELLQDDYLDKLKIIFEIFTNCNHCELSLIQNIKTDDEIAQFSNMIFINDNNENNVVNKSKHDSEFNLDEKNSIKVFFQNLLCPRNVMLISDRTTDKSDAWKALTKFIVFLLENNFINEDSITNQCLTLYRNDWSQRTLEGIAGCMKKVTKSYDAKNEKFTKFLDFLSEFCINLHNE